MKHQFDHEYKKTIHSDNCAIVNLTHKRYKRSNLYSLYTPSSLVRANYEDDDNYAVYEKQYDATTVSARG
jgi:hypothetical protein